MTTKIGLSALALTAVLGAAALAPTLASASGHSGRNTTTVTNSSNGAGNSFAARLGGLTRMRPVAESGVAHQASPDFWRSAWCRRNPINCDGRTPGTYANHM
jgi:hypothetical protein